MANRRFEQFSFGLEKYRVSLYAKVTFGNSGAPTLGRAKGIASITRNSAGLYTIQLGMPATSLDPISVDLYNALLDVHSTPGPQSTAPAAPVFQVVQDNVQASGQIQVKYSAAGTATDPASGEAVYLEIVLVNQKMGN